MFGSDPGCGTGYPEIFRGLHQPWSDADSFQVIIHGHGNARAGS
jgi:hypothetical protein